MIDPSIRLRRAIHLNSLPLVTRLIRTHPHLLHNPDFTDKSNTSLHLAASLGHTTLVSFLLTSGHEAEEITRNADHDTPLMLAARAGHLPTATLLLQAFPRSIPYTNRAGLDALALAARNPASAPLLEPLLDHASHPASVHVRDADGNTALHHASAAGSLKALRVLLAAGADPLARNCADWTPLAYSQTVAAEVYFKNLVGELERRRVEGVRVEEERERRRMAGVRVVAGEGEWGDEGGEGEVGGLEGGRRDWSPVERRRPGTPGGGSAGGRSHEWDRRAEGWGFGLGHARTRSGSGGMNGS